MGHLPRENFCHFVAKTFFNVKSNHISLRGYLKKSSTAAAFRRKQRWKDNMFQILSKNFISLLAWAS